METPEDHVHDPHNHRFMDPLFLAEMTPKYSVEERLAILEKQHLIFASVLQNISSDVAIVREVMEGSKTAFTVIKFLVRTIKFLGSIAIAIAAIWGVYITWKTGGLPDAYKPN